MIFSSLFLVLKRETLEWKIYNGISLVYLKKKKRKSGKGKNEKREKNDDEEEQELKILERIIRRSEKDATLNVPYHFYSLISFLISLLNLYYNIISLLNFISHCLQIVFQRAITNERHCQSL